MSAYNRNRGLMHATYFTNRSAHPMDELASSYLSILLSSSAARTHRPLVSRVNRLSLVSTAQARHDIVNGRRQTPHGLVRQEAKRAPPLPTR